MPLQVGIIGAGIGGLSAAIALRRTGAEVEVFEKSHFKNEVGGAITITPNGGRILHDWGLDSARANVTMMHQQTVHDATTMAQLWSTDLTDVEKNYGTPFEVYHRVDLHQELRRLAQAEHLPGKPSCITLGKSAVDVDCSNGIIEFEDGSKVQKDLIIIAAGVKTNFTSTITGKPEPVKNMGWSTYRGLIPMHRIFEDDVTRAIWEGQKPGYWVIIDHGKLLFTICYACRGGKMLNIAMRTTTQPDDENKLDWNNDAKLEDVLAMSKEYHPALGKLWEKVLALKVYNNLWRDPLDKYTRGRAVIIGDAAHTIAPQHVQGATLAIEEAAALELLLTSVETVEPVSSRLALYEKTLKKHLHIVQLLSDSFPTMRDAFRIQAEELWGPGLPPVEAAGFSPPFQKFLYGYDVRAEVMKAMEEEEDGL